MISILYNHSSVHFMLWLDVFSKSLFWILHFIKHWIQYPIYSAKSFCFEVEDVDTLLTVDTIFHSETIFVGETLCHSFASMYLEIISYFWDFISYFRTACTLVAFRHTLFNVTECVTKYKWHTLKSVII